MFASDKQIEAHSLKDRTACLTCGCNVFIDQGGYWQCYNCGSKTFKKKK